MTFLFILMFFVAPLKAESLDPYDISLDGDEQDVYVDEDDIRQEELDIYNSYKGPSNDLINTGYVVFPFYRNADGQSTAYGIDAMYYFRRSKEPPLSKPSYIRGFIAAGKESYTNIGLMFNNYWRNESNNLYAAIGFERRLSYYYKPFEQNPVLIGDYRSSDTVFDVMYRQKFTNLSYLGVGLKFRNFDMHSKQPPSSFVSNSVLGLDGGHLIGIGGSWSSMEPGGLFFTNRGFEFELSSTIYTSYLGSSFDLGVHQVDLRENIHLARAHILLLRFFGRFITGEPPYFELSSVGDVFNAYPEDLYRDRHLMAINGEYRLLLISVIMLRGFLGIAYHAPKIAKFKMNEYLPCYGGGLSFVLDRQLGINAGFQYIAGRGTKGVFFGVGESY